MLYYNNGPEFDLNVSTLSSVQLNEGKKNKKRDLNR